MEPIIGQLEFFGFNFAPVGWAQCNGQLMSISENSALFALIGTNYGGDGVSTFALPDLRGRAPINQGGGPGLSAYAIGQMGGSETVSLTPNQMPAHNHVATLHANAEDANSGEANGKTLGIAAANIYNSNSPENSEALNPNSVTVSTAGGSQPHNNMQPFLVGNWCIATEGIFPSRS